VADRLEGTGLAVADGDDEAAPGEQLDLGELDDLQVVVVAGGLEHEEQAVAVAFELGPLVGLDGVLDGEGVQLELGYDRVELAGRRLVEPDPHERVVGAPPGLERVLEVEVAGAAVALLVDGAIDDHGRDSGAR
jgi:hypothetical protein